MKEGVGRRRRRKALTSLLFRLSIRSNPISLLTILWSSKSPSSGFCSAPSFLFFCPVEGDFDDQKIVRREMGLERILRPEQKTERSPAISVDKEPLETANEEVNPRESNPYLKNNGSGYPEEDGPKSGGDRLMPSSIVGDGQNTKEVVAECWGSLGHVAASAAFHRAAPSRAHLDSMRNRRKGLLEAHQTAGLNEEEGTSKKNTRNYSKDVSVRNLDMRVAKVDDSLSWRKRRGQNPSARDADAELISAAMSNSNKYSNEGSFMPAARGRQRIVFGDSSSSQPAHGRKVDLLEEYKPHIAITQVNVGLMENKSYSYLGLEGTHELYERWVPMDDYIQHLQMECQNLNDERDRSDEMRRESVITSTLSNIVIGRSSHGTTVFKGTYDNRPVAVKRLVRGHWEVVMEIQKSILDSPHPNLIAYYAVLESQHLIYIAQELCTCSLNDLVRACLADIDISTFSDEEYGNKLENLRVQMQHVKLWTEYDRPSPLLLKLMGETVLGVAHLHQLEIFHGDLRPHNVLITGNKILSAKLSEFGIKCMYGDNPGSGWQAPEMLLPGGCPTRATDMFSLGCVLYFCVTGGQHAFGEKPQEREIRIESNEMDLSSVSSIPEAHDLILLLLNPDPELRPKASEVRHHPFFWTPKRRLLFLSDVSKRVESEGPDSPLLNALEKTAPQVFDAKWGLKKDAVLMNNQYRHRTHNARSVKELLRVVRDEFSHHAGAPKPVKAIVRTVPDDLDADFAKRFPTLVMESFRVVARFCKREWGFRKYFPK